VPFSPLGKGFLTGAIDKGHDLRPATTSARSCRVSPPRRWKSQPGLRRELLKAWRRPRARRPAQIALAWLLAQRLGSCRSRARPSCTGWRRTSAAAAIALSAGDLSAIGAAAAQIDIQGARLPEAVLAMTNR
jgi:aryl-alcohol dehydrogenase-like predicted oxidoreductase